MVLSKLPVTNRFISGTQATSFMGASCMATVTGWPPDSKGHIFTCLSQPPEKTVVPSSFQAEHKTCKKEITVSDSTAKNWVCKNVYFSFGFYWMIMRYWCLGYTARCCSIPCNLPTSYLWNYLKKMQLIIEVQFKNSTDNRPKNLKINI